MSVMTFIYHYSMYYLEMGYESHEVPILYLPPEDIMNLQNEFKSLRQSPQRNYDTGVLSVCGVQIKPYFFIKR